MGTQSCAIYFPSHFFGGKEQSWTILGTKLVQRPHNNQYSLSGWVHFEFTSIPQTPWSTSIERKQLKNPSSGQERSANRLWYCCNQQSNMIPVGSLLWLQKRLQAHGGGQKSDNWGALITDFNWIAILEHMVTAYRLVSARRIRSRRSFEQTKVTRNSSYKPSERSDPKFFRRQEQDCISNMQQHGKFFNQNRMNWPQQRTEFIETQICT